MSKTIGSMMFVLGAAIGSAVTWRYVKQKYEKIAEEEIDSVKEVFSKKETHASSCERSTYDNPDEHTKKNRISRNILTDYIDRAI